MGTSNAATLRALAAAREAAAQTDLLADIRTEARRAADNSQYLRDALMGEPEPETPEPVEPTEPEVTP
ncbi:MAG: hypothetical protein ACTH9H_13415 [Galactobacter sp.]